VQRPDEYSPPNCFRKKLEAVKSYSLFIFVRGSVCARRTGQRLSGADSSENCGLEFAMLEIKKAAEKLPQ